MNAFIRLGALSSLVACGASFALNPIQGFYVGIIGEVSHTGSLDIVFTNPINNRPHIGTLDYNSAGGGGGGQIGYRIENFRVEGELLYNRIAYDKLKFSGCTIQSPSSSTPVGYICPSFYFGGAHGTGLGFSGSTAITYGMVNGYYDFVTYGNDVDIVPYVGLGLGYANVHNSATFYFNSVGCSAFNPNCHGTGFNKTGSAGALQGILGVSFYLDDFTWVGVDFRYITTNKVKDFNDNRFDLSTLNLNINFSLDKG